MDNNKKILVPMILGVTLLVVLVVGATYAYFAVGVNRNFGTSTITAEAGSVGTVSLTGGKNISLKVEASDMMQGDSDVTYYASATGKTTAETSEVIGVASVEGEGTYECSYTLTLDDNENSMYDAFQSMEDKSEDQIVLTVDGEVLDFNTASLFPKSVSGTISGITEETPQNIMAQLKLVNKKDVDQTDLAGTKIDIGITLESLNCSVVEGLPDNLPVSSPNLSTKLLGGLYRYQGTAEEVDDNYVCYNPLSATECTGDNVFIGRIIGVTPEGNLKVVIPEPVSSTWSDEEFLTYPNSNIYDMIQSAATSFESLPIFQYVKDTDWKYGTFPFDVFDEPNDVFITAEMQRMATMSGDEWYEYENAWTDTVPSTLGILYMHDYYYQLEDFNCEFSDDFNTYTCPKGWLNISTDNEDLFEWTFGAIETIEKTDTTESTTDLITINHFGSYLQYNGYWRTNGVFRYTFYVDNNITLTGEGTITNPYMMS